MSPSAILAIASAVGAIAFAGAGYLLALRRAGARAERPVGGDRTLDAARAEGDATHARLSDAEARLKATLAELARMRDEAQRVAAAARDATKADLDRALADAATADHRAATLQAELARLKSAFEREQQRAATAERAAATAGQKAAAGTAEADRLSRATAHAAELDRQVAAVSAERGQLAAALASEKRRVAELEQRDQERARLVQERTALVDERDRLRREAEQLAGRVGGLERAERERHDLALQLEALRGQLSHVEQLRAERQALEERLLESEKAGASRVEAAEVGRVQQDLVVERQLRLGREQELERAREDNAKLRAAVHELDVLRAQLRPLEAELAALRARGLAVGAATQPRTGSAPPSADEARTPQALLERVFAGGGLESAAIADEQGLIVAGIGPNAEELSACAAQLVSTAEHMSKELPIGRVGRVVVGGEHGLLIQAWSFQAAHSRMLLVTLGVAPDDSSREVTEFIEAAPSIPL